MFFLPNFSHALICSFLSILHLQETVANALERMVLPFLWKPSENGTFNGREVIEVNFRPFGAVYSDMGEKYQNCGGTLISTRHVLTAAHCLFDPEMVCQPDYQGTLLESLARDRFTPGMGDKPFSLERAIVDLDGLCLPNQFCKLPKCNCLSPNRTRQVAVSRAFIPSAFPRTHCALGDIALLELAEEIAPRRVHLARWQTPLSHPLFASGYGYNPSLSLADESDQMMTANVSVLDQCPPGNEQNDAICADELALGENACQGDSGAGLRDLEANIFGIVAFGTPCDEMADDDQQQMSNEKRHYQGAVYTNVTFYLPFICSIVTNASGCLPEDVERAGEQPYFQIARDGQISGVVANFE